LGNVIIVESSAESLFLDLYVIILYPMGFVFSRWIYACVIDAKCPLSTGELTLWRARHRETSMESKTTAATTAHLRCQISSSQERVSIAPDPTRGFYTALVIR
jgi:hypothetical protein